MLGNFSKTKQNISVLPFSSIEEEYTQLTVALEPSGITERVWFMAFIIVSLKYLQKLAVSASVISAGM